MRRAPPRGKIIPPSAAIAMHAHEGRQTGASPTLMMVEQGLKGQRQRQRLKDNSK
jgi:hypothetical protein